MKTVFILLTATLITTSGFSQTDTVFYSEKWEKTDASSARFYRTIDQKDSLFIVNDFDISNNHLMRGTYISMNPEIENGDFIFYYPNGRVQAEGSFYNGKMISIWKYYNKKGKISKKLDYSVIMISNSDLIYPDVNDKNDDEPFFVEDMPQFQNGTNTKFTEYLYANFNMPIIPEKYGITGRFFIQLWVDKKGRMVNTEIKLSLHPHIDCEINRIIANAPDWKPGTHNGELIAVFFTFPFDINK